MKGLLRRLVGLSKVWLATLLAPAEDPRQTFGDVHARQRESLDSVRRALVTLTAVKQRLQNKMAEVRRKLPEFEEQALRALADGREESARLALRRRQLVALEVQRMEAQAREVEKEEQRLALVEQRLAARVEAYFARKEVLAARHTAAEAQVRINETLSGVSRELGDLGLSLERAEQETARMEERAMVIDHLIETGMLAVAGGPAIDPLERRFDLADVADAVEEQLASMRCQLGTTAPPEAPDR